MKHYIKLAIIYMARICMRIFYIFLPIKKNRILFSVHEGKRYNCNPKYIFEALYEAHGNAYEYVWCISDPKEIPDPYNVRCARFMSIRHLFYLATSAVIISNIGIEPFVPRRKKRIFISTTHGSGAYKKGISYTNFLPKAHRAYMAQLRDWRAAATDYVISGCCLYTELISKEAHIAPDKFLPIGMPRNDIFFQPEKHAAIRKRICEQYHIDDHRMLVLYAPTYRGHWRTSSYIDLHFDPDMLCNVVQRRFGRRAIVLYRSHLGAKQQSLNHIIDVSSYPDMQELLVAADILISDYSSSIWDYSFTGKAGFLYTPDLQDYKRDTDFHCPIDLWQYPHAETMEDLCRTILDYDESAAATRIKRHHDDLGSYEHGTATRAICTLIEKQIATI